MKKPKFRAPAHATIAAYLALFIALGGTAYAAVKLPAHSVGTKQLKNHAVTASKVRHNALTGRQIKESTLHKVPKATNADKLGGRSAAAFAPAGALRQIDVEQTGCVAKADPGCSREVLDVDGFTLTVNCGHINNGTMGFAVTAAPQGAIGADFGVTGGDTPTAQADPEFMAASLPWGLLGRTGAASNGETGGGAWILQGGNHTITVIGEGIKTDNGTSASCRLLGTALVS